TRGARRLYTRQADGSFRFTLHGPGSVIPLVALDLELSVDVLYEAALDVPGADLGPAEASCSAARRCPPRVTAARKGTSGPPAQTLRNPAARRDRRRLPAAGRRRCRRRRGWRSPGGACAPGAGASAPRRCPRR